MSENKKYLDGTTVSCEKCKGTDFVECEIESGKISECVKCGEFKFWSLITEKKEDANER